MRTDEILEVVEVRPLAVPDEAPVPTAAAGAAPTDRPSAPVAGGSGRARA